MQVTIEVPDRLVNLMEHAALLWSGPGRIDPEVALREFTADALALQAYFEFEESSKLGYVAGACGLGRDPTGLYIGDNNPQGDLRDAMIQAQTQAPAEAEVAS